jgi:hypothetical protein
MVDPLIVPAQTVSSGRLLFGNLVASVSLALFQPTQDWKVGRWPPDRGGSVSDKPFSFLASKPRHQGSEGLGLEPAVGAVSLQVN